jgi:hypothetical protein
VVLFSVFSLPSVSALPLLLSPFLYFVSVSPLFLLVVELLSTVALGDSRFGLGQTCLA